MISTPKQVFICEDHLLFTEGLQSLIAKYPEEFSVVETCQNGTYAARKIPQLDIDILLLDLNVPGTNGFEVIKELRSNNLDLVIIVITMYDHPSMIKKVKTANANAYLLKDVSNQILLETMRKANSKTFMLQEGLSAPETSIFKEAFTSVSQLTLREKETIQLISTGKTTQEIASKLFVSVHTIETHRRNIYRKLDVKNVTELINLVHKYDVMG